MGRCGCIAVGLVLLVFIGGLWLRSRGGLNAAMAEARRSQQAAATQVARATAEYTDREVAKAVMTQAANDIGVVADVAKTGMDDMRDVSVAASAASVVSSITGMGTVVLIVLGLGIVLLLLAKLGGA